MKEEMNILDEYYYEKGDTTRVYSLLLILLGAYLLLFSIDTFFVFKNFALKQVKFDWVRISIGLVLPGIGVAFLIKRSIVGWVISMLFFSFFASVVLFKMIADLMHNEKNFWIYQHNLRQGLFLLVSFLISMVLFTKNIRTLYNVKKWILLITVSFSLFIALLINLFG